LFHCQSDNGTGQDESYKVNPEPQAVKGIKTSSLVINTPTYIRKGRCEESKEVEGLQCHIVRHFCDQNTVDKIVGESPDSLRANLTPFEVDKPLDGRA
jgi:hypothetical protein